MPSAQTVVENGVLAFSSAGGNAITVSDIDANAAAEQVTLSTSNATLSLGSTAGLAINAGGNGQSSITFTGTLDNINAALSTLTFTPTAGDVGSTSSSRSRANDLGNSGSGGQKTAMNTFSVNVIQALVVTTATDVSDGDTSSIANLLANPGADGKISLREAIAAVNNTAGQYAIDFDIPGSGVQTISVASPLPRITRSVIIDGTTQPGYAGVPLIEIDGQATAGGSLGLAISASNCTILGLAIYGFTGNGIDVLPGGHNHITIQGNYIGITAAGTAIYNGDGVVLANSANDIVGGTTPLLQCHLRQLLRRGPHLRPQLNQ